MSHVSYPEVSVIIPVYNRASLLKRAIRSALVDREVKVKIVVVDDGSSDESAQVAESFGPSVTVLRQQNAGPSAARNRGFAASTGRYVRFLDSDDWLLPGANARQLAMLRESDAGVCYGDWRNAFAAGDEVAEDTEINTVDMIEDPVKALMGDVWNPNFCYLLRRELVETVGGWDENRDLIGIEDFDFILRIAIQGSEFVHLDQDVGRYYHHDGERTSRDSLLRWCQAKKRILGSGVALLEDQNAVTDARRSAVALTLLRLAKTCYGLDKSLFRECLAMLFEIDPGFRPPGVLYRSLVGVFGYEFIEAILEIRRKHWTAQRVHS
jgi:glycosyltransferase involved in cell wall biosynthesis